MRVIIPGVIRYVACSGLFILSCFSLRAQPPEYYLNFDHILDNREYFSRYAEHQTIFGARINPGVAFSLDTFHSVHAGINYMYEYGGKLLGVVPQIDLYYSYQRAGLKMYAGSFPRRELLDYPLMLMTDSLDYYRPNMEGSFIGYSWDWGSVSGWVDWTGRASEETRESILAGLDATISKGLFMLSAMATRYHLARSTASGNTDRIRDDGSVLILAGADLSPLTFPDHLKLSTGIASFYLWERPLDNRWYAGWFSRADMKLGWFGIRGAYYLGDPSPLRVGDPLYRSGNYGRVDLYVDPFKNRRISSMIGWSFHFIGGEGMMHSQRMLIRITLP
ncbi:MAG: hypothetical protein R6U78_08265 [Bacteroidales bacterium]